MTIREFVIVVGLLSAVACQSHDGETKSVAPGSSSLPTKGDGVQEPSPEPTQESAEPIVQEPKAVVSPSPESTDILKRKQATTTAKVKHVLVGWKELSPAYAGKMDERAMARTKSEADALAARLLGELRGGADMDKLMKEHSEDLASAATGKTYTATPAAGLVPPFKAMALRLRVGEGGLVETLFGWHIIQRVE